jgi:hypothetical protein
MLGRGGIRDSEDFLPIDQQVKGAGRFRRESVLSAQLDRKLTREFDFKGPGIEETRRGLIRLDMKSGVRKDQPITFTRLLKGNRETRICTKRNSEREDQDYDYDWGRVSVHRCFWDKVQTFSTLAKLPFSECSRGNRDYREEFGHLF